MRAAAPPFRAFGVDVVAPDVVAWWEWLEETE
jgi:hypothetical protein